MYSRYVRVERIFPSGRIGRVRMEDSWRMKRMEDSWRIHVWLKRMEDSRVAERMEDLFERICSLNRERGRLRERDEGSRLKLLCLR